MNEQTTKLLEQLANKLGTTVEYLWSVLLKQAGISASKSIITIILLIGFGIVLYKIHLKLMRPVTYSRYSGDETKYDSWYEKAEEGGGLVIAGYVIFVIVAMIVCCLELGNIINALFNPEYWALKEILSYIK